MLYKWSAVKQLDCEACSVQLVEDSGGSGEDVAGTQPHISCTSAAKCHRKCREVCSEEIVGEIIMEKMWSNILDKNMLGKSISANVGFEMLHFV